MKKTKAEKWEEETIKVLKLEVEKVPINYAQPYVYMAKKNPLKLTSFSIGEITPEATETFTKESYRLEVFGYKPNIRTKFYIKEGQLELFKSFIKDIINAELHQQRQEIIDAIEKEAIHISAGLSVKVDCNTNSLVIDKADLRKHLK